MSDLLLPTPTSFPFCFVIHSVCVRVFGGGGGEGVRAHNQTGKI